MITWMQKHKRYLIITIWISTIAFVAAGMVGWGAYSFSTSSGALAKVGNININADDFNREYNFLFSNYNERFQQINGTPLDREQAKELGLEDLAMSRLINKALFENFALDSGIRISDEEVIKEISEIETFKKDGIFDNNLYKEVLKQNRMKPSDFEENMKKEMLIGRVLGMFPFITTPLEKEILSIPERLQNRLSIQIIRANQVPIDLSEAKLKEYYESHKDLFKTQKSFEVIALRFNINEIESSEADLRAYYEENKSSYLNNGEIMSFEEARDSIENDFNRKEAQRNALKEYVNLKDGKITKDSEIINENDVNEEILSALNSAREGDFIKPILSDDEFITFKLIKKIPQEIKSFDEARFEVIAKYRPIAQGEALKKEAESKLNIFRGNDIGFVGINATGAINGLNAYEQQQLLSIAFSSKQPNGFVMFDNSVVLYKITEQRMLKKSSDNIYENRIFGDFKSQIVEQTIVDFLSKKYKIINNFKKDS